MNDYSLGKIEQIVTGLGYECVNIAVKNDFGKLRIQILIDTLGGINVDDCETVSKRVSRFLDDCTDPELDKGRYYLEVSSPGLERPLFKLTDYERFTGRSARVRLSVPMEGRHTFSGVILGVNDGFVNLQCEDGNYSIAFAHIKAANLVYRFDDGNNNKDSRQRRKGRKK